ncbi:MAG: S8 family peptidase [Lachnospirales bacterium]
MKKFRNLFFGIFISLSVIANNLVFVSAKDNFTEYVLSDYVNNEVFITYNDGSNEVISYNSLEELEKGIETIKSYSNVLSVQPNFDYNNTAITSTNDPLIEEQWALKNDGDFYMEEQKNQFPVFDLPFGIPQMPGQWHIPDNFGIPGGIMGFGYNGTSSGPNVIAKEDVDINADEAWNIYNGGKREVIVAIIDTGVDYTHEDIAENIWINEDEIPNNGIDDDNNGYTDDVYGWNFYNGNNHVYIGDEDSHGTHGAGTIAAKANNGVGIAGINQGKNVKVMVCKALGGSEGTGKTQSIINAIKYAEANGASICNLSLGTSNNDEALYNTIAQSSMLFVVAAGNNGTDIDVTPTYPASYDLDNIISVANVNYDGSLHYSSGYGKNSVDVAAPGSYILSTTVGNTYSYMTGTSMAAPMVSGGAAMIYSHFDNITLADVKDIIINSVKPLDSLKETTLSGGMLNLSAALKYDTTTLSHRKWSKAKAWSDNKNNLNNNNNRQTYIIIEKPKNNTNQNNGSTNKPAENTKKPETNNQNGKSNDNQIVNQWMNQVLNDFFNSIWW